MKSAIDTINKNGRNIIKDNSFLFDAFANRLVARLVHIFEKYRIPMNKNILQKNIHENLINNLKDINTDIIEKYINLISKYEKVVQKYVEDHTDKEEIKKATMKFITGISDKNKTLVNKNVSNNFIEYINSIIYVYDNNSLNRDIINRINDDVYEIINEFNRNNYNYVIESINIVIKNIISNM